MSTEDIDLLLLEEAEEEEQTAGIDKIVQCIRSHGGGLTMGELIDQVGIENERILQLVSLGIAKGKLSMSQKICKRLGEKLITLL
jgi:hypothetical protein